jgi:cell division protein FtsB
MSLLSGALGLAGGSQLKLIAVVVGAGLLITAVGGGLLYVHNLKSTVQKQEAQIVQLKTDNAILTDNNAVLKDNMKKLATANFTNWQTAQSLIADREKASTAISNLAAASLHDKKTLDRLNQKITDMLKDPKNDGAVAPVLREIIREIQKERTK